MFNFLKRIFARKDNSIAGGFELSPDDGTWFDWLDKNPSELIHNGIAKQLIKQVPETIIDDIKLADEALSTMGLFASLEDRNKMIVGGAGIAIFFKAVVHTPNEPIEYLEGFFSWVAVGLNTNQRYDRIFLDLGEDAAYAEERLRLRVLEEHVAHKEGETFRVFEKMASLRSKLPKPSPSL